MNKENQIEEIADKMVAVCDDCNECHYGKKYGYGTCTEHQMAEKIYEAGYRKANEVRKETICRMIDVVIDAAKQSGFSHSELSQIIGALVDGKFALYAEYGLETDE